MAPASDPRLLPGRGEILIAFSGGPDSVCLASWLAENLPERPLLCVHIDHGMDSGSAERAARAQMIAGTLGLRCQIESVDVKAGQGPEGGARRARYACFARLLAPDQLLVTAHHADDQAETILMRLLRGAGASGLAGIPAQRVFADGWLARPLLGWPRPRIMAWLADRSLRWVDDPANRDLSLDRNFIRHEIMPRLRARWPGVDRSVLRSGELCAGAAAMIEARSLADLDQARISHDRLCWETVAKLPVFRQAELLRRWCLALGIEPPPGVRLDAYLAQLRDARPDRSPELRWHNTLIRHYNQQLWLQSGPDIDLSWSAQWSGQQPLALPMDLGELALSAPLSTAARWEVHLGSTGERIQLRSGGRHAVKKLMNEARVAPWRRRLWPRLWQDGQLLAVGDRWLDSGFRSRLDEMGLRLEWRRAGGADGLP